MDQPKRPNDDDRRSPAIRHSASLTTVAREWTRIGVTGFGGPPAHIALLRELVVDREGGWTRSEFQDANAACGLLPGPASTQLAIFCAYRVAGPAGAIVGGLGFIVPAVVLDPASLAAVPAHRPPLWVRGAGAGAGRGGRRGRGARRARPGRSERRARPRGSRAAARWGIYLVVGAAAAALLGAYLVLALLGLRAGRARGPARPRPGAGLARCCSRPASVGRRRDSARWPGRRSRSGRCRSGAGS